MDRLLAFDGHPGCGLPADAGSLLGTQILSYYGNPYTADMGILGELSPEDLVAQLEAHAEQYDALNGPTDVQPAMHIVYGTAQPAPGTEGLYLQYLDDETLEEYLDVACEHGLLVFLDLQIGRSDVASEVEKVLPYLERPNVHLAIDPEFAMPSGVAPGDEIGAVDADDINAAQSALQDLVDGSYALEGKVLIVHQFLDTMITRPALVQDYPDVRLVVDMDGFGPAEIKEVKYGWYARPAEHAGIKLFFKHDPDLMAETEVLALDPDVIIYQ